MPQDSNTTFFTRLRPFSPILKPNGMACKGCMGEVLIDKHRNLYATNIRNEMIRRYPQKQ